MLRDTAQKLCRRVTVGASGDLSHRLKAEGPYSSRAEGSEYDARLMEVMDRAAFGGCFDGVAVEAT